MKTNSLQTEFNVARLGLISIQQRLPLSAVAWEAGTLIDGEAGTITCVATPGIQVPHGIDGDVASAVITLYFAAGTPSDRLVRTNMRELMQVANFDHVGGKHYQMFKDSLTRLNGGQFTLKSAWKRQNTPGRLDARFYIVESLTGWQREVPVIAGRQEEDLVIGLSPHLAYSATSGYLLSTQPSVMRSLSSAGARGQYRLFEALRADPDDPTLLKSKLQLSLQEFTSYARLLGGAQDAYRVRRIVEPALEQLRACQYLEKYEIVGRGSDLRFVLEFSGDIRVVDQRSVTLLEGLGVDRGMAEKLALAHSRAEIEAVCWSSEEKTRRARNNPKMTPITNIAGLIVTKLRSGEGPDAITKFQEHRKKVQPTAKPKKPQPEGAAIPEVVEERTPKMLHFLLKGKVLSESLLERLEVLFLTCRISFSEVTGLKTCTAEEITVHIDTWEQR